MTLVLLSMLMLILPNKSGTAAKRPALRFCDLTAFAPIFILAISFSSFRTAIHTHPSVASCSYIVYRRGKRSRCCSRPSIDLFAPGCTPLSSQRVSYRLERKGRPRMVRVVSRQWLAIAGLLAVAVMGYVLLRPRPVLPGGIVPRVRELR